MARLTEAHVRHIARLARLELTDAEVHRYASELTAILGYIDQLQEVNTENVQPTAQVTGLTNTLRPDQITPPLAQPDDLLMTSPLTITEHQIETPSAHG